MKQINNILLPLVVVILVIVTYLHKNSNLNKSIDNLKTENEKLYEKIKEQQTAIEVERQLRRDHDIRDSLALVKIVKLNQQIEIERKKFKELIEHNRTVYKNSSDEELYNKLQKLYGEND